MNNQVKHVIESMDTLIWNHCWKWLTSIIIWLSIQKLLLIYTVTNDSSFYVINHLITSVTMNSLIISYLNWMIDLMKSMILNLFIKNQLHMNWILIDMNVYGTIMIIVLILNWLSLWIIFVESLFSFVDELITISFIF